MVLAYNNGSYFCRLGVNEEAEVCMSTALDLAKHLPDAKVRFPMLQGTYNDILDRLSGDARLVVEE